MSNAPVLITAALPYANGPIHIGHLVEYTQADIYARHLRLCGRDAIYLCADDTHGTPIEVNARKAGVSPEEFIGRWYEDHVRDFEAFGIRFELFSSTNTAENREYAVRIYEALKAGGHIVARDEEQTYCETDARFLPDRFVKGTCPYCKAGEQYGDVCESCRKTYNPTDLLDPRCVLCDSRPIAKVTRQLYFQLSHFTEFLRRWVASDGHVQPDVQAELKAWLGAEEGLHDWCISRDGPYFGFEIPDEPGKFFYVWLDAPIGYISTTHRWCDREGRDVDTYWKAGATPEVIHFIGKDITYFHTLFWPAMLEGSGFRTPSRVHVHGFLKVDGAKMSKSRGTLVTARTYLEHLDPQYLRYYFAAKLGPTVQDLDLNLGEFVDRVNAELVNNLVNLVSRTIGLIRSRLGGRFGPVPASGGELEALCREKLATARSAYDAVDYARALRAVVEIGNEANRRVQDAAPWDLVKSDPEAARVFCTEIANVCKQVAIGLKPVLPVLAEKIAAQLGTSDLDWNSTAWDVGARPVGPAERLLDRVDKKKVKAMIAASVEGGLDAKPPVAATSEPAPAGAEIVYDDFAKVDLRVGVVKEASLVEGADRLLRFVVQADRERTVFAGIRKAYPEPSALVGKRVLVVVNLKPKKTRFGVSEGMLLVAASPDDNVLRLASFPDDVGAGWKVH